MVSGAEIETWADGFGRWYASVPPVRGGLAVALELAKTAIHEEIVEREWKTNESLAEAFARIPAPALKLAPPEYQHPPNSIWHEDIP